RPPSAARVILRAGARHYRRLTRGTAKRGLGAKVFLDRPRHRVRRLTLAVSLGTGLSDLRRSVAMSSSRVVRRALGPIVILSAFLGLAAAPPPSLAAGALCNTPGATPLCAAADPLPVFNNQHYTVQAGATITSTIVGATDLTGSETCTGGGAGVDVFIKGGF